MPPVSVRFGASNSHARISKRSPLALQASAQKEREDRFLSLVRKIAGAGKLCDPKTPVRAVEDYYSNLLWLLRPVSDCASRLRK